MSSTAQQDFGTPLLLEDYRAVIEPVTTHSAPLCAACNDPCSSLRCSTCKSVHYCSTTCQAYDWSLHKLLCKQSTTTSRPDSTHRRALFLPDDKDKPRFVWLKYNDDGCPLDKGKCFPAVGTQIGNVKTIAFHDRFLPCWIQISYDSNPLGRELQPNQCVKRLLGLPESSAGGRLEWRGPLVVIAYSVEEGLSKPALDVGPAVLGALVGYLVLRREYVGPVFVEQPQEWLEEGEWDKLMRMGRSGGL